MAEPYLANGQQAGALMCMTLVLEVLRYRLSSTFGSVQKLFCNFNHVFKKADVICKIEVLKDNSCMLEPSLSGAISTAMRVEYDCKGASGFP